jgi:enoyl-[acyl-carrier protein] reductase I
MDFLSLKGEKILIFGLANRKSVAFHISKLLADAGAELIFSVFSDEHKKIVNKFFPNSHVFICDLSNDDHLDDLFLNVKKITPELYGIVHSVAFANFSEGLKPFHDLNKNDFLQAIDISCFSLIAIAGKFNDILKHNAAIITISISTTRMAAENYGYMAPVKAALDSSVVFLAKSLGNGVRVNAVGASLLKTSASAGIPGYVEPYLYAEKATIRKQALKTEEVANTAVFLLSPRASGITAQTIVVDAGMSVNYFDKEIIKSVVK